MKITNVAYYTPEGRIVSVKQLPLIDVELNTAVGTESLVGVSNVDTQRHYVLNGDIAPRPDMGLLVSSFQVAPDTDWLVSGIPPGTIVNHPGGDVVVDDGVLEWSTPAPGKYFFRFVNFPYEDAEVSVEVTA